MMKKKQKKFPMAEEMLVACAKVVRKREKDIGVNITPPEAMRRALDILKATDWEKLNL